MCTSTSSTAGLLSRIASFHRVRDFVAGAHAEIRIHHHVDVGVEIEAHLPQAELLDRTHPGDD
jgi:hypothetical protein